MAFGGETLEDLYVTVRYEQCLKPQVSHVPSSMGKQQAIGTTDHKEEVGEGGEGGGGGGRGEKRGGQGGGQGGEEGRCDESGGEEREGGEERGGILRVKIPGIRGRRDPHFVHPLPSKPKLKQKKKGQKNFVKKAVS